MSSFYQLTINEWLKLFKKKSFYVAFVIMTLFPIGQVWIMKQFADEQIAISLSDFTQSTVNYSGGGILYVFLCMIYMASIVSSEYRYGTIKLLLIRAHSRNKILASKYTAMLVYLLVLMLYSIIISSIIGALFIDSGLASNYSDVFKEAGYTLIYSLIYLTIIFMLSVLTKSTGATIGITFILVFLEGVITMLLSRYEFAKYILFFHTDLKMYEQGMPILEGITLGFSITVIVVYMMIMLGLSFFVFNKRDVS